MSMTDRSHIACNDREEPVLLAWPTRGHAGAFIQFEKAGELTAQTPWSRLMDRYGGRILAERRNSLAHGEPFDGLPTDSLLELAKDLINFAYCDYIAYAASLGIQPTTAGRA